MNPSLKVLVFTFSIIVLLTCVVSLPIISAESAPIWLKKGSYAQYSFYSPGITFYNSTFLELDNNTLSTLRWECVNLDQATAQIVVALNGVTPNGTTCSLTTEVDIDVSTRSVYFDNGSLIGTSHLWLPPNPSPDTPILLWDVPPDRVQLKIIDRDEKAQTCQGIQKSFTISDTITGLKKIGFGGNISYIIMFDYDTGVLIDSANNMGDQEGTLKALDVMFISVEGLFTFSDTNIDLGPTVASNNYVNSLLLIIPFLLLFVVVVIAFFVRKRGHYKGRKKRVTYFFSILVSYWAYSSVSYIFG